jgi:hypothetical protein
VSNAALVQRIREALDQFLKGESTRDALISTLDLNGHALEGLSGNEIQRLRDLVYQLEVCSFADEVSDIDDCSVVVDRVRSWLLSLPSPIIDA